MEIRLTKSSILYGVLSLVFIGASSFIVWKITKEEVNKGAQENQEKAEAESEMPQAQEGESGGNKNESENKITVESKDDANEAMQDMDRLVDSIEKDNSI
jgi:hypothetical protein